MAMEATVAIKQHTVMSRTIGYCQSGIASPTFRHLTLVAEGKAVNKCISILEILKRDHPELSPSIILDASPASSNEPRLMATLTAP
jgi:hypothetical protein